MAGRRNRKNPVGERSPPAPARIWGRDPDRRSLRQLDDACRLPVSVAAALMPDAHSGYGLPIGGVLAARAAVIPYAVGMDIACRMKISVLDLPPEAIHEDGQRLRRVLESETGFGVGAEFRRPLAHPVMDEDWSVSPVTADNKDRARRQLGTSGSGNHFVEFGELSLDGDALGLAAGRYTALLSHSGSRGVGGAVAQYYSREAQRLHPELPKNLKQLAWLDIDSRPGREYWAAMQLMGRYAAANHELIHERIARALETPVRWQLENHHNFAWREHHFGEELIVHRKGATPAGRGQPGIIPGSMASPAYVCCGKGHPDSLNSAAHGAGRVMSRTAARKKFNWPEAHKLLRERGVVLISAGLDEVPMSYKDIDQVMAEQSDLVEIVARFDPRLVKMAP